MRPSRQILRNMSHHGDAVMYRVRDSGAVGRVELQSGPFAPARDIGRRAAAKPLVNYHHPRQTTPPVLLTCHPDLVLMSYIASLEETEGSDLYCVKSHHLHSVSPVI